MNVYSGDTEFRTSVAAFNGAAKGLRAHWSAELDYRFVKTLAEHTVCNEQDGIVFKHKYADAEIIEDVSRDIANKKPIQAIVHDLAIKFPNKIEQHRSRECIELLMTLRNIIPEFNFQQINNKHINMWTRVIVPFRQAFDCGTLYKGKSMLHKDCKRFTKAIMEFIANASIKGVNNVDYNIFRKPGKGSKLLEQWITAMLHTHKLDMVKFLIACGARLAFTYLKSRPAETLNFNEQNYLRTAEHSPKEILVILKRYMDDIIRQENIDSSAELGVVTDMMSESMQSFRSPGSVYSESSAVQHADRPVQHPAQQQQQQHHHRHMADLAARYHRNMAGYSQGYPPGYGTGMPSRHGPGMPPGYGPDMASGHHYQPYRYPDMGSPRAPPYHCEYQVPTYEHRQHPPQWPPMHSMQHVYHTASNARQYPAIPVPSSARYHPYAQHPMADPTRSQGYQPMRHPMHPPNVAAYGAQRMHRNMPSFPSTAGQHPQQRPLDRRESSMLPAASRDNSRGSGTPQDSLGERRNSVQLAPVYKSGSASTGSQPSVAGQRRGSVQLAPVPVNDSKPTATPQSLPEKRSSVDSIAQNKLLEGRRGSVQLAPVPANYTVETVSQRAADQSIVEEPQPNIMESTPQMRSAISHMGQETSSVNAEIQTKTVSAPVTPNLNMRTTLAARSASASNPSKTSRDVLAAKDAAESVDAQQNSVASTNEKSSKTSSEYHHPASIVSLLSR